MKDLISRQAAIDALCAVCGKACDKSEFVYNAPQDEQVILCPEHYCLCTLPSPSAQPECSKEFVMLKVRDLNGRPYYSIIYLEEGCEHEGYASYDLMVISEYLKRYFGFAQPEIIRCRDCVYKPCKMMPYSYDDDFCSYAERKTDGI